MNIIVHGMEDVDYDKIKREELNVPNEYQIETMFAAGKLGDSHAMSEKVQAGKTPSDHKVLSEFVFENNFSHLSKK